MKATFWAAVPSRALLILALFAQPELLTRFILFIKTDDSNNASGYGFVGAFALMYGAAALLNAHYSHCCDRLALQTRALLIDRIYERLLFNKHSESETIAVTSLISVDVEAGVKGIQGFHEIWATLTTTLVAVWLLYRQIGIACIAPILCMAAGASPQCAILASYGIFAVGAAYRGVALNATRLVSSLALLTIMSEPISFLLSAIPTFTSALICLHRIELFLKSSHGSMETSMISDGLTSSISHDLQAIGSGYSTKEKSIDPVVVIRHGAFGWSGKPRYLEDISLEICASQVNMIIGPVGSGKSTLLYSILGETYKFRGLLKTQDNARIGFCAQSPWLVNDTIQSNILGESNFDVNWYETVIEACALLLDFSTMPKADQTVVGTKAASLSGGQKQRISLARAIYSRAEVLLLDDVFSGLDNTTKSHVFNRLLGSRGLLRNGISVLHYATNVTIMENGAITARGGYQQLRSRLESLEASLTPENRRSDCVINSSDRGQHDDVSVESRTETPNFPSNLEKHGSSQTIPTTISNSVRLYKYYVNSLGFKQSIFSMLLLIILWVERVYSNIWLQQWASANNNAQLGRYIGFYAFLVISNIVVLYFVLVAPLSMFNLVDAGVLVNRFVEDINTVDNDLPKAILNTVSTAIGVCGQIFIVILAMPAMTWTVPPIFALTWAIQRFYLNTSSQLRVASIEAKAPLLTHFLETTQGLVTVRAFGWQVSYSNKHIERLEKSQESTYLLYSLQVWLKFIMDLVVMGIAVLLVTLSIHMKGYVSEGILGLALVKLITLGKESKYFVTQWTLLEQSMFSISRIFDFIGRTASEETGNDILPTTGWPHDGSVEFQNVSAHYKFVHSLSQAPILPTKMSSDPSQRCLHNINLTIPHGERVAICGRTGSGKTSLISSLLHTLSVSSGDIHLSSVPLSTLSPDITRSYINVLPQEPLFVIGSVRHNMTLWSTDISDKDIIRVLQRVNLWDNIESLGGLNMKLDSDRMLSQGQAQLFCLARAMLKKRSILILDEATSSVDRDSETIMQNIIRDDFESTTVIAVVHRLRSIVDFDRVVVMDKGAIVECGKPRELLKNQKSKFKLMWDQSESGLSR
ncbi:uncharacterized protein BP5553_06963 [Venustampulla echinocandica]|uniref:P-loop containing nucleoside triphosphate hydrolase n=1 Tax=Venustampulla echinocandica TaxID=2656787 RepID=A0A370TI56_9HELO|nr:uncharacterized protein BP5553_06963 [Venustampulla echinocandica]RDL35032.1 hypothetical protein BP5553_06963 [Venustampulla echinocandica]